VLQGIDSVQPTGSDECFLDVLEVQSSYKLVAEFLKSEVIWAASSVDL
jgi:hypothetical protein